MEHIIIGFAIAIYCALRQRWVFKVDWLSIAKFVGFMCFITAIRFGLMDSRPTPQGIMTQISFANFLFVWLEDMYFTLPIYFVKDYLQTKKWMWVSFAALMSIYFAMGHIAYGPVWAIITLLYPYFISYKNGMKYGFGTVMVAHILYDFITLLSIKLHTIIKVMSSFGIN